MQKKLQQTIVIIMLTSLLAALAVSAALAAIVVIDDFTPASDVTLSTSSATPAMALTLGAAGSIVSPGNERDVVVSRTNGVGSAEVQILTTTDYLNFNTSGGATGTAVITWDADELSASDAGVLTPMADVDLLSSNNMNIRVEVLYTNNPVGVQLEVFNNGVCYQNSDTASDNISPSAPVILYFNMIQFTECTTGTTAPLIFFSAVDGIRLTLTATTPDSEIHLELVEASSKMDHGDLPESYGDARHSTIAAGTRLGTELDTEDFAAYSANALGDDLARQDDEDGVTLTPGWRWLDTGNGKVDIVVAHCQAACTLAGWIDWNNDGFDAGDLVYNALITDGTHTIEFAIPDGAGGADNDIEGTFAARFRLFVDSPYANPSPVYDGQGGDISTYAVGGEVEDYFFEFSPTAVTLSGLSARTGVELSLGLIAVLAAIAVLLSGALILARRKA